MEVSKERAEEIHAAWEAASPIERLRLPRLEWVTIGGKGTSYFEHQPSKLESDAADRIAELEAALRKIADGCIDMGGCRRPHPDSMRIASDALKS